MITLYLKAIHIIFVITWFAGLFYIVRLFIYHVEAAEKPDDVKDILQKQYKIMEKRLWNIITAPSMVLAVSSGLWMMFRFNYYIAGWMHMKLLFVLFLLVYHFLCLKVLRQLQNDQVKYTSTRLRIWNEVATVLLVAIVFLAVVKSGISIVYGLLGLFVLSLIMILAIKFYKSKREKLETT